MRPIHDEKGIIWPDAVAPFSIGLINLKANNKKAITLAEGLYESLQAAQVEVLYDDRDERAGTKFANMGLNGLPWQVAIGNKTIETGVGDVKNRRVNNRIKMAISDIIAFIKKQ